MSPKIWIWFWVLTAPPTHIWELLCWKMVVGKCHQKFGNLQPHPPIFGRDLPKKTGFFFGSFPKAVLHTHPVDDILFSYVQYYIEGYMHDTPMNEACPYHIGTIFHLDHWICNINFCEFCLQNFSSGKISLASVIFFITCSFKGFSWDLNNFELLVKPPSACCPPPVGIWKFPSQLPWMYWQNVSHWAE